MEMILHTKNLTKTYQKKDVVKNVCLHIPKGKVYGLLGPNGAGKSTILKMISGIARPSDGTILFDGHTWTRVDLKQIGALIETPPIYPNLTAYENMKVRALLLGISEDKIEHVLETVGLQDTGKKRVGQFSLGMKQRLGIAVSILNEPKLLILDEPTNGLDPFGIEELRNLIRSFTEKGMTVLLSSHILSEVKQVADFIGILSDGELKFEGPINEQVNLEELFMNVVSNCSGRNKHLFRISYDNEKLFGSKPFV